MKIRAAVLERAGEPFAIQSIELGEPRAGEVRVRMLAAGICHSDWHLVSGATRHPFPVVAGHEGSGIVEAAGPGVTRLKAGDFVTLNWAPACGTCFYCLKQRPSLCATYVGPLWNGTMLDGQTRLSRDKEPVHHFCGLACFAEFTVVPEICCVPTDPRVSPPVAALIGCAVTTGYGAVIRTARLEAGASVVVLGAGGVGLSIVMAARLRAAGSIIAVDNVTSKLALAREFGATSTLLASLELRDSILALTGGRGADVVFEAAGVTALQEATLDFVRPGGVVVLVGLSAMGSATNLPGAVIVRQEKTVTGSYYGSSHVAEDFPAIAAHHLAGRLDLDRLVTRTYSLDAINDAYADLHAGRLARGVIVF